MIFLLKLKVEKNKFQAVLLVMILIWMGAIFYFSSQSSSSSLDASGELLVKMNQIDENEIQNISDRNVWNLHYYIRKSAHFIMYSGLAFLITLYFIIRHKNNMKIYILSWFLTSLYGLFDELHQNFVPGRGATFADVRLDSTSAIFGVIASIIIYKLIIKHIIIDKSQLQTY